jgi:hypothetical protein
MVLWIAIIFLGRAIAFTRVSDELLPWTWSAFGIAVVTGALMFAANAVTCCGNASFRWIYQGL